MQYVRQPSSPRAFATLAALALCLSALPAAAQNDEAKPAYRDYKGVSIGLTADECRAKLGDPTDKGDTQDFYSVNDKQTVQVYYGPDKKVSAVVVTYLDPSGAPPPKSIFGSDVEAKPDGSMHRLERYPKAGFWLSYSRTAGDSPLVVVTLSKIQ